MLLKHQFSARRERGLGLVELMVGITIGLIVTAGASMVAINQVNEHRRLMLETQLQQDLRTAADIIQRDLRRIGFRGNSPAAVWAPETAATGAAYSAARLAVTSPYNDLIEEETGQPGTELKFNYAVKNSASVYAGNSIEAAENMGVKWDQDVKTLYVLLGVSAAGVENWQPITDPQVVKVTDFSIQVFEQKISAGEFCDTACTSTATGTIPATCPQQLIRRIEFVIKGQANHDANVNRTIRATEFVRSNGITGVCPA